MQLKKKNPPEALMWFAALSLLDTIVVFEDGKVYKNGRVVNKKNYSCSLTQSYLFEDPRACWQCTDRTCRPSGQQSLQQNHRLRSNDGNTAGAAAARTKGSCDGGTLCVGVNADGIMCSMREQCRGNMSHCEHVT